MCGSITYSFIHLQMNSSLNRSSHYLTERSHAPPPTTSFGEAAGPGQSGCSGAPLKGGLSSLDYPVVNSSPHPTNMVESPGAGGGFSSLVSNTGSFYSTDFNSLSLVDEGQREMLSGNMSLSVLHLYETQYRRRFHGSGAGTSLAAGGHVGGLGSGRESYSYTPLPGLNHPTSAIPGYTGSRASCSPQYQVDSASSAKGEHYQFPSLSTSSFAPTTLGYQASSIESSSTTPVGGAIAGTVLSYPHDTGENIRTRTILTYPYQSSGGSNRDSHVGGHQQLQHLETSSPADSVAVSEHRRLMRLSNAPPSLEDTETLTRDFQYGSTVFGNSESLHPLAQRFRRHDEFGDEGVISAAHLPRPSQSPSQATALSRPPNASSSPTSPIVQGSKSQMPQIEEDMSGEQELDTSNLKPNV